MTLIMMIVKQRNRKIMTTWKGCNVGDKTKMTCDAPKCLVKDNKYYNEWYCKACDYNPLKPKTMKAREFFNNQSPTDANKNCGIDIFERKFDKEDLFNFAEAYKNHCVNAISDEEIQILFGNKNYYEQQKVLNIWDIIKNKLLKQ